MPRSLARAIATGLAIATVLLAMACATKTTLPVAPSAPRYPDFVFPAVTDPTQASLGQQQRTAWAYLQSGDLRSAERTFGTVLRLRSGLVPGESGLGYVALARKQAPEALQHFERALQAQPGYAPALAGRGDALAAAARDADAVASYEAAVKADPSLDLGPRIEVVRMRGAGDAVKQARRAAELGHLEDARRAYALAIQASPDSAFLYRELAIVESRAGSDDQAIDHLRKAISLDATDAKAPALLGDALVRLNRFDEAVKAYESAQALEPSPEADRKLDEARRRAEMARLPAEYQAIAAAPEVTRGDVAAVIGVRLGPVLPPAAGRPGALVTDIRGHWASGWILDMVRTGIMDPLPNHTFQPRQRVRRSDFATTVSRLLALTSVRKPAAGADWRTARLKIADVPPTYPTYPAISQAAASGVLPLGPGETFNPTRPLTGRDLVDAVSRLEALFGPVPRRR